ncbi:MAG: hypothetical protein AB8H03_20675 [Saprospiraceae bacterium]
MKLTTRLIGLTLFFITLQFQTFGQKDFNKLFFPKNKTARWLMSHWGKKSNVKTLKKFDKKFDGENDIEEPQWNYQARKDKIFIKLNSEDDKDGIAHYDGLYIERGDWDYPTVTFAGSTKKSEVLKKISNHKDIEIVTNEERTIAMLYHPMKVYLEVGFHRRDDTRGIYSIRVSSKGYENYYKEVVAKKSEVASTKILTETDFRFDQKSVIINAGQVKPYNTNKKEVYQIVNIRYEGPLKNGVPQGKGKWGVFTGNVCPRYFDKKKFIFFGEGEFENGKAVNFHHVKMGNKNMIFGYVYGKIKQIQEEEKRFVTYFHEDGSYDDVREMPIEIGTTTGLIYSGKVDKNKKPHDENGVIYFGLGKKVKVTFVHGLPKKGTTTVFEYENEDIVITAHTDENFVMNGKVEIRGTKKGNEHSGFVYMRNGQPDLSKDGYLTFENFSLSNDLKGKFEVRGKIKVDNFRKRLFEGKDLKFSFADYPDTKFKGDLKAKVYKVIPTGWHTVTEGGTSSLRGKYTPNGDFLEGDNIYQKGKAWNYDSGYFTDSRNGKKYLYGTYIKEDGKLITWMLEDIHFEDYTNEVWSYGSGSSSKKKCYYSKRNSKIACPSGWRLPNIDDVNFIKKQNTKEKTSVTDNKTLINILSLHRNGYVWKKYRGTEMYQEEKGVFFWLNNGKYISISYLNQGSFSGLDADDRFHTCRCVKDGAVEK